MTSSEEKDTMHDSLKNCENCSVLNLKNVYLKELLRKHSLTIDNLINNRAKSKD